MFQVDLNSDLGESFGNYKIGMDEEILKYVSSANIACGWHGGDPMVMDKTVSMANKYNIGIGAHPGFFDLMGFGRRSIDATPEEIKNYVKYQLGALMAFSVSHGEKIQHVKVHGAMYNMAAKNEKYADSIAQAIYEVDKNIILLGLANSEMIKSGKKLGLKTANEVFADRAYNSDATLVSRSIEGAVIHDAELAISRVIKMIKTGKITSITGEEISIKADSVCVHGDNPKALDFVKKIRKELEKESIRVTSISNFIK
ncbi:5-oxoprolinase subunit PxpA [uncultured Ilyobacter sp.]|uniref:LamB/YcsF family protein n=1 Tax=uncultured Ilyobacter sp. TaxID=544433 RepID=UPI0029F4E578|nr:5-oxoprolinase subunit PxpA [uncultured Ilyobacter sp.]